MKNDDQQNDIYQNSETIICYRFANEKIEISK